MPNPHIKLRTAIVGALAALAALVAASSASAVQLSDHWAAFNRCPVDDPAMLAGSTAGLCVASDSPHGSFRIGNTTTLTGDTNLQFGVQGGLFGGGLSLVSPPGGAIVSAPASVPGGLLGLTCPTGKGAAACNVTATVQAAGAISDFNLFAGLSQGQPIVTVPVKIHLQNLLLGNSCYIGSNANPIVLGPENLLPVNFSTQVAFEDTDLDGTPNTDGVLDWIQISGLTQGDSTFSVPKATGCGSGGFLSAAINLRLKLPSPSGNNNLVLNQAVSSLRLASGAGPVTPQQFSDSWHSAVLP
jgi:hypothetical protein